MKKVDSHIGTPRVFNKNVTC